MHFVHPHTPHINTPSSFSPLPIDTQYLSITIIAQRREIPTGIRDVEIGTCSLARPVRRVILHTLQYFYGLANSVQTRDFARGSVQVCSQRAPLCISSSQGDRHALCRCCQARYGGTTLSETNPHYSPPPPLKVHDDDLR